jgi:hypothetical protein
LLSGLHGPSTVVLRSQPLLAMLSQLAQPLAQVTTPQLPPVQLVVAVCGNMAVQFIPQAPQ